MQPVTSIAWMFASTRNAGFSRAGPDSKLVTVTSQMSRPSYDFPIDSTFTSPGSSSAQDRNNSVSSPYRYHRSYATAAGTLRLGA